MTFRQVKGLTSEQKSQIVTTACIVCCFLCLGYAAYCLVTIQMNRALLGTSGVILFMRINLWFLRRTRTNGGSKLTNEQHLQSRLDDALNMGHLEVVRQLLEQGADVNGKDALDDTPLMVAAYTGQADAVRLLLEFGADTNTRNYIRNANGITAREIAQELGHQEVLSVFAELSAR